MVLLRDGNKWKHQVAPHHLWNNGREQKKKKKRILMRYCLHSTSGAPCVAAEHTNAELSRVISRVKVCMQKMVPCVTGRVALYRGTCAVVTKRVIID